MRHAFGPRPVEPFNIISVFDLPESDSGLITLRLTPE